MRPSSSSYPPPPPDGHDGGATILIDLPAGAPEKSILVVDDEPDIAELLAEALRIDGHRVDTADSGAAALSRLLDRSYDLVFSDMKMPGMSGAELYDEIARRRPGLERRIIFVTGDMLNPVTRQFLDRTGAVGLSKPFQVDAVRRLAWLHASPPSEHEAQVTFRA